MSRREPRWPSDHPRRRGVRGPRVGSITAGMMLDQRDDVAIQIGVIGARAAEKRLA